MIVEYFDLFAHIGNSLAFFGNLAQSECISLEGEAVAALDEAMNRRAQREKHFQQEARRGLVMRLRSSDVRSSTNIQEYLRVANLTVHSMDTRSEAMAHILMLQGLTIGHVVFPRAELTWARERQTSDRAVLIVVNSGEASIAGTPPGVFRRPGVLFVAHGKTPVTLSLSAVHNEILYLALPSALIADIPMPHDTADIGPPLPVDVLRPIFQFFTTVARSSKPQQAAASMGFVVSEMLRTLVRVVFEDTATPHDLYAQTLELMHDELNDETLNTARLAERLGVATRTLQLEFQRRGTTLQAELRRLRTEAVIRARTENPEQSFRTLAEAYGFRSKSALYRALAEVEAAKAAGLAGQ